MNATKNNDCPLCNFSSYHTTAFLNHIWDEHDVDDIEEFYIKTILNKKSPVCKCGCGQRPSFLGWKKGFASLIRGHNGSILEYHLRQKALKLANSGSK